jgi:predicted phosphoribosyltransferase
MEGAFQDRAQAGRELARELARLDAFTDPLVLALPRGGVPVGYHVARALKAPLDVLIVRKLGHPLQPELAIGALASGGIRVLNREILSQVDLSPSAIDEITEREAAEVVRRERAYRGDATPPAVAGRSAILVDDGVATGSTMSAAVAALRRLGPREVVVAVPVAPPETCARLRREADRVVCLKTPVPFMAIGLWYVSFPQLADQEVQELLSRAAEELAESGVPSPPPGRDRQGPSGSR